MTPSTNRLGRNPFKVEMFGSSPTGANYFYRKFRQKSRDERNQALPSSHNVRVVHRLVCLPSKQKSRVRFPIRASDIFQWLGNLSDKQEIVVRFYLSEYWNLPKVMGSIL